MNREDLLIFEAYKKGKTKKTNKSKKHWFRGRDGLRKSVDQEAQDDIAELNDEKDVCNCSEEGTCDPCKKKAGK